MSKIRMVHVSIQSDGSYWVSLFRDEWRDRATTEASRRRLARAVFDWNVKPWVSQVGYMASRPSEKQE